MKKFVLVLVALFGFGLYANATCHVSSVAVQTFVPQVVAVIPTATVQFALVQPNVNFVGVNAGYSNSVVSVNAFRNQVVTQRIVRARAVNVVRRAKVVQVRRARVVRVQRARVVRVARPGVSVRIGAFRGF